MSMLRRTLATAATAGALLGATLVVPAAASATPISGINVGGGAACTSVTELGTKKVVWDKGMQAFTVRQYKGYCYTSTGTGWRNFASVYVWKQYHDRGFAYRAYAGVNVLGELEPRGFTIGGNRQRLTYSAPVATLRWCTQGWGKLYRSGSESNQGLTSLVC